MLSSLVASNDFAITDYYISFTFSSSLLQLYDKLLVLLSFCSCHVLRNIHFGKLFGCAETRSSS